MERRLFTKTLLTSVASFALMESLFASNAIDKGVRPITNHWSIRLNEYCQDLYNGSIPVLEWQDLIHDLYNQIELHELLSFVDFQQLKKSLALPDLGVTTSPIQFPKLDGLPESTVFLKKIFGMRKDRAIIPHGHSNMASAHLILEGQLHLRHYQKVRHENNHLIVYPSVDKTINAGDYSTISDERDNIHWFIANSSSAYTFDVIMLDLNQRSYDIHNLDMDKSEDLHNGNMRVPILDVETALKKYGKHHH